MMSKPEIKLVAVYNAPLPSFSATVNDVGVFGVVATKNSAWSIVVDAARVRFKTPPPSLR